MINLKALIYLVMLAVPASAFSEQVPFLADRHANQGVKCESCHNNTGKPESPSKGQCLMCHGGSYEKLAEQTDKLDINPHASHLGKEECVKCHRGHKPPTLVCARCHDFSQELHIK